MRPCHKLARGKCPIARKRPVDGSTLFRTIFREQYPAACRQFGNVALNGSIGIRLHVIISVSLVPFIHAFHNGTVFKRVDAIRKQLFSGFTEVIRVSKVRQLFEGQVCTRDERKNVYSNIASGERTVFFNGFRKFPQRIHAKNGLKKRIIPLHRRPRSIRRLHHMCRQGYIVAAERFDLLQHCRNGRAVPQLRICDVIRNPRPHRIRAAHDDKMPDHSGIPSFPILLPNRIGLFVFLMRLEIGFFVTPIPNLQFPRKRLIIRSKIQVDSPILLF